MSATHTASSTQPRPHRSFGLTDRLYALTLIAALGTALWYRQSDDPQRWVRNAIARAEQSGPRPLPPIPEAAPIAGEQHYRHGLAINPFKHPVP